MTTDPLIAVKELGKTVTSAAQPLRILHDLSFTLDAGATLAVVGASGSGKSTLLGLLAGLDTPTKGSVTLAGQNLNELDEDGRAELRGRLVGFVFQSFHLLSALTALENVLLPLELLGMPHRKARQKASEMLQRVGLARRLTHRPQQLSGGEQQRVALARAFAVSPRILFADEPTGNLDAATGAEIIELMFALNVEAGTTLVLVTHDDALAKRCGRTLLLSGGRLLT